MDVLCKPGENYADSILTQQKTARRHTDMRVKKQRKQVRDEGVCIKKKKDKRKNGVLCKGQKV
jgi:hypothetical protein